MDYSIGFGGAIKSLSLTLRALDSVEGLLVTSQSDAMVETWFAGHAVERLRRHVNYRAKQRAIDSARPGLPRAAVAKAMAAADVLTRIVNTRKLHRLIVRERIDLVHLNNGFVPPEALLAAEAAHVPCIVHLRDFQRERGVVQARAGARVARVVAVSAAVAASARVAGVPPERIAVVNDPVDLDAVAAAAPARSPARRALGLASDQVAIGMFGRIVPWKGQLEFVRAAVIAMQEDPAIRAVIVGDESDGGTAYLHAVTRAAIESGLVDRFVFTGYRPDVEALYHAMDIVVHASITPEPFGMIVPEAMAAGRAVIAADAGGPREVITHGRDGVLVAAGDVAGLAQAMRDLAGDAERRQRLGDAARRTAVARFGIPASARAVAAIYDAVLAGAG